MAGAPPVRIHLPWTAAIIPLMLFVCITPLATAGGGWIVLYAVPAIAVLAAVFSGTTATSTGLSARWLRGRTRVAWQDLLQLEFPGQRWAVAVTQQGRRVLLPGTRPADLPRLVNAAGGRLFVQQPITTTEGDADQSIGSSGEVPADALPHEVPAKRVRAEP